MSEEIEIKGIDLTDESDLQDDGLDDETELPEADINSFLATNDDYQKSKSANLDVLRIEETISGHWNGVKSCCRQSRVNKHVKKLFEGWVKTKLYEHRDLQYLQSGHGGGRAKCSSSGGSWGSPRKCRGSIGIKCFIEFLKNQENTGEK